MTRDASGHRFSDVVHATALVRGYAARAAAPEGASLVAAFAARLLSRALIRSRFLQVCLGIL